MFINGQWLNAENDRQFSSFNPANGEKIASIPDGGKKEAQMAVAAAHKAF